VPVKISESAIVRSNLDLMNVLRAIHHNVVKMRPVLADLSYSPFQNRSTVNCC